jgi:hypothetical protein
MNNMTYPLCFHNYRKRKANERSSREGVAPTGDSCFSHGQDIVTEDFLVLSSRSKIPESYTTGDCCIILTALSEYKNPWFVSHNMEPSEKRLTGACAV